MVREWGSGEGRAEVRCCSIQPLDVVRGRCEVGHDIYIYIIYTAT